MRPQGIPSESRFLPENATRVDPSVHAKENKRIEITTNCCYKNGLYRRDCASSIDHFLRCAPICVPVDVRRNTEDWYFGTYSV